MFVELLVLPDWYSPNMSVKKDANVIEVTDVGDYMVYSPDLARGVEPRTISKRHIRYYIPESLAEAHQLIKDSEQRAIDDAKEDNNAEAVRLLTDSV